MTLTTGGGSAGGQSAGGGSGVTSGVGASISMNVAAVPSAGQVGGIRGYSTFYAPSPPVNEPIAGPDGTLSPAWSDYFAQTAVFQANSYPAGIGDYRTTAAFTLDRTWLLCDGSAAPTASYPKLSAVLLPLTGGSGGTFNLPNIATGTAQMTFIKAL